MTHVFSCEFCKIFRITFFIEHLRWLLLKHISERAIRHFSAKKDKTYFSSFCKILFRKIFLSPYLKFTNITSGRGHYRLKSCFELLIDCSWYMLKSEAILSNWCGAIWSLNISLVQVKQNLFIMQTNHKFLPKHKHFQPKQSPFQT